MKAFTGRKMYSGAWNEDITEAIEVFGIACDMCLLNAEDRRDGISIMLKDDALSYFASNLKHINNYDEVIKALRE